MNNLCFLDAGTLGDDADLSIFHRFGKVTVYPNTQPEEVAERIKDQHIIITNQVVLNESSLQHAPEVKLICAAATGTDNIDLQYARSRNIPVTNVAGYSTDSVVQHTFALLFYLLESLSYYDQYVKSGKYAASDLPTHLDRSFWQLQDKTWGIIGLGTIGKKAADIAQAFGCRVVYYSTSGRNHDEKYTRVDLHDLLRTADIVSIHAPLNPQTDNLITYEELKLMKKQSLLLNMGRGGIVNEADLARALDEGMIAGAGLDVLGKEPMEGNNPLLHIKDSSRLIITPHIAWASIEARFTLLNEIVQNIEAFLGGIRRNVVN